MQCVHTIVCFDLNNNALLIKIILSSFKFLLLLVGLLLKAPRVITHTTLGDYTFLAEAPKLWNSLPVNIRNEQKFLEFLNIA